MPQGPPGLSLGGRSERGIGIVSCRYLLLSGVFLGAVLSGGLAGRVSASILGDSNGDNPLDVADPVYLLNYLYRGASPLACLLYTSPSPRDAKLSRMPSSA